MLNRIDLSKGWIIRPSCTQIRLLQLFWVGRRPALIMHQPTTKSCAYKKRRERGRSANHIKEKRNSKYQSASKWEGGGSQSRRRCHQENSFSFFSSVLIKNLIEINQAIKSGRCNSGGGGGGSREKGERVSAQSEKDLLIQILTTTPNGTECVCVRERGGEQGAFIIRERSSLPSFLAHSSSPATQRALFFRLALMRADINNAC